jgi:hypothetical protein
MFSKYLLLLVVILGLLNSTSSVAAVNYAVTQTVIKTKKKNGKVVVKTTKSNKSKSKSTAKNKRSKSPVKVVKDSTQIKKENDNKVASIQMIDNNQAKTKITDSIHRISLLSANNNKEGYFASMFSNQTKSATIQTLEGTAAVFKSISGWDDGKFYILTNQMPIGTIVRITTPELKSICAKVINSLPDVGNAVQYRLSDAAATILGITNKIFKVSVTY